MGDFAGRDQDAPKRATANMFRRTHWTRTTQCAWGASMPANRSLGRTFLGPLHQNSSFITLQQGAGEQHRAAECPAGRFILEGGPAGPPRQAGHSRRLKEAQFLAEIKAVSAHSMGRSCSQGSARAMGGGRMGMPAAAAAMKCRCSSLEWGAQTAVEGGQGMTENELGDPTAAVGPCTGDHTAGTLEPCWRQPRPAGTPIDAPTTNCHPTTQDCHPLPPPACNCPPAHKTAAVL